jgi:membrane-associated phospholipid phosphatase
VRGLVIAAIVAVAAPAAAQNDPDDFPGGGYFYDAGAIGLVYVPIAVVAAVELGFDPPDIPRWFSTDPGGASPVGNTVPEISVALGGAAIAAVMFGTIREGRWFHLEGMAQSMAVTLAITSVGKNLFGRRRPHWIADSLDPDLRRSFPSGHSSTAFSIATYGCLFLHREAELDAVRGLSCAALLAAAGLTAYSRIRDNRHHLGDVIAGGALGNGASLIAFILQETRYRNRSDEVAGARVGAGWGLDF